MHLPQPLLAARLVRRYKRFLVDVRLHDGQVVTAHCANSGSMMGLLDEGNEVLLSRSANPKRKLPYTLELLRANSSWIGVNTLNANRVVGEALQENHIRELRDFESIFSEVTWKPGCRFDFMLQSEEKGTCYVEVKNVTLYDSGRALFPDARTARGLKHLHELIQVREAGCRAVIFFLVHRDDCDGFRPAEEIDPEYALALQAARQAGVEVLAYRTAISPPVVQLSGEVKLQF